MRFMAFEFIVSDDLTKANRMEQNNFNCKLGTDVESLNEKGTSDYYFLISGLNCKNLSVIAAEKRSGSDTRFRNAAINFVEDLGLDVDASLDTADEITLSQFSRAIDIGQRNSLVGDIKFLMNYLEIDNFPESSTEFLVPGVGRKAKVREEALQCGAIPELSVEIDRIFKGGKGLANPVQYVIMSDSEALQKKAYSLLIGSLYSVGRISMRRVCSLNEGADQVPRRIRFGFGGDLKMVENWYRVNRGGTVIVHPVMEKNQSDAVLVKGNDWLPEMLRLVQLYHRETLTIFSLGKEDNRTLEKIRTELPDLRFVVLRETSFTSEQALLYLENKAREDKIVPDEPLSSLLKGNTTGWYVSDLDVLYGKWFDKRLCTVVYPQYATVPLAYKDIPAKPKGNAWQELSSLIGLSSVKEVIGRIIDAQKASMLFKDQIAGNRSTSRHMVFTGNPGTAKTTVARLFAQIMKDNGVLRDGNLIEVGRGDIVSRYVGGTAPLIQDIFKRASGNVLFIDEAYSLVDGQSGLYGDEAINTIVQEMENHRDDTIVIFAGYPDKMEDFLSKNPGLRSRIAFHISFPDYSADELMEILSFIAGKDGISLDDEAKVKVRDMIAHAIAYPDFGNGRFARNLYEQAVMRQMQRLLQKPKEEVTSDDLHILRSQDFEVPSVYGTRQENRKIGFV